MTLLVLAPGCSPDPLPPADLLHDFEGARSGDVWAAPFPGGGHFVDGHVQLAGFPNPDGVAFVEDLVTLGHDTLDGAGTTSPVSAVPDRDGVTRIVVQHAEDGVEDGHEVMFQLAAPKVQLRSFLTGLVETPVVPSE